MSTRKRPKLNLEKAGGIERVRVPMTGKQVTMLQEAEAEAQRAVNQRQLVLNTIAAGASYDGVCNFIGIESTDGKHYLVLEPIKKP